MKREIDSSDDIADDGEDEDVSIYDRRRPLKCFGRPFVNGLKTLCPKDVAACGSVIVTITVVFAVTTSIVIVSLSSPPNTITQLAVYLVLSV